ncbi:unnamed protein product [Sphagnum troendelagicum]|uniref:Uncharacterized protein n=1 Tax=Sphagnum troendelagicum TaxID=128251 RepID=A0ABP0TMP9_9BRYO
MTSKNFPALLKDWWNSVLQLGNGEPCQQWAKRIQTTLKQAHGMLMMDVSCRLFHNAGLQSHELVDILFQIGSIAEAPVSSRAIFPQNFVHHGFGSWLIILNTRPYIQHTTDMVANGWCPFTIEILSESIAALCIPAVKDMRKQAIGLMAKTYNEAEVVLVIYSGIQATSVSTSHEEKLLHLLSSGWMQQLWTLQEGILAQKLVFEFSDGLVALEELLPMGEEMFNPVLVDLAAELFQLKKHQFRPGSFDINDMARALRWQTTKQRKQ